MQNSLEGLILLWAQCIVDWCCIFKICSCNQSLQRFGERLKQTTMIEDGKAWISQYCSNSDLPNLINWWNHDNAPYPKYGVIWSLTRSIRTIFSFLFYIFHFSFCMDLKYCYFIKSFKGWTYWHAIILFTCRSRYVTWQGCQDGQC